jgi:hypothetical protein
MGKIVIKSLSALGSVGLLLTLSALPRANAETGIGNLGAGTPLSPGPTLPASGVGSLDNLFGSCVDTSPQPINQNSNTDMQELQYQQQLEAYAAANGLPPGTFADKIASMPDTFNPGPMCTGSDSVDNSTPLDCDSTASDRAARRRSISRAFRVISCKQNKLAALPNQLNCLSKQAEKLDDLIDSLKQTFAQKFGEMATYVSKLNTIIQDRQAQEEVINSRLEGPENGNPPGLLALEKATDTMVRRIFGGLTAGGGEGNPALGGAPDGTQDITRGQLQAIKESLRNQKNQRAQFEQQLNTKKMGFVGECFKDRPQNNMRCEEGGPLVSPRDYILCRYRQNQTLGAGGRIESNPTTLQNADTKTRTLDGLLSNIFADAPNSTATVTSPEQAAAYDRPISSFTVADVEHKFGTQLASFNGAGLNIHDFVIQQMNECFTYGTSQLAKERANKMSSIYMLEDRIKVEEERTSVEMSSLLKDTTDLYTKDMVGLTGEPTYTFNTSLCDAATPEKKLACIEQAGTQLKNLLDGNTPETAMAQKIPGNDANTDIRFTCQGIRGCITSMNTLKVNLQKEKGRIKAYRGTYVAQANASAKQFVAAINSAIKAPTQKLRAQLQALNANLAILGTTIDIPDVDGGGTKLIASEDPEMDGLLQAPDDVKKLLAETAQPKIPDISGNNFSQALDGVGKVAQELGEKQTKLAEATAQISGTERKCLAEEKKAKFDKLARAAERVEECASGGDQCRPSDIDNVESLMVQVEGIKVSGSYARDGQGNSNSVSSGDIEDVVGSLNGFVDSCRQNRQPAGESTGRTVACSAKINRVRSAARELGVSGGSYSSGGSSGNNGLGGVDPATITEGLSKGLNLMIK